MSPEDVHVSLARIDERIERQREATDQRVAELQRDYGRLDGDIGRVSRKVNETEGRMDERINRMEDRLDRRLTEFSEMVAGQIDGLEGKIDKNTKHASDTREIVLGMRNRAIGFGAAITLSSSLLTGLILLIIQAWVVG